MNLMFSLKNFIDELDEREYYRYLLITLGVVLIFVALMFYLHKRKVFELKQEAKKINRQRKNSRELLERYTIVKNQKKLVDEILSEDKAFKIKEYFSSVVNELNLVEKSSKEPELSIPQDLENGYSEISLDSSFSDITMQKLSGLLYETEKNRRIYLKELSIKKSSKTNNLDVTLVIATLQPKTPIQ